VTALKSSVLLSDLQLSSKSEQATVAKTVVIFFIEVDYLIWIANLFKRNGLDVVFSLLFSNFI
jgi:hypothetical protein